MGCPFHSDSDEGEGSERATEADADEPVTADTKTTGSDLDRRAFMKSALLIGGASALETSMRQFGLSGRARAAMDDNAVPSIAERANRQHAWDAYEAFDSKKETSIPPGRHLFLLCDYLGDGRPTESDRRTVGAAFDGLESAFGWSNDGLLFTVGYSPSYFDRYDEDLPLGVDPDSGFAKPGLLRPQTLIDAPGVTLDHETPVADTSDVLIHLASDHEELLLAAEELLWTGSATLEDTDLHLDYDLGGVLSRPEEFPQRRVGFAGADNLKEEGDAGEDGGVYPEDVPVDREGETDAKLSMGFNDLFRNSIPRETNATMLEEQKLVEPKPPGQFAQGTIQHLSKLDMNLDPDESDPGFEDDPTGTGTGWYQYDDQQRVERMFSPDHELDDMGLVGEDLGNSNAPVDGPAMRDVTSDDHDVAELTEQHAENRGVVGHAQKCARARFDLNQRLTEAAGDEVREEPAEDETGDDYDSLRGHDGVQETEQVMLRRDVDTTDEGRPGNHFMALMRFNPYMVYMRQAMNGVAFDSKNFGLTGEGRIEHDDIRGDVDPGANGIVNFLKTKRRGNFLVPPLRQRALPPAQAARPPMTILSSGEPTVEVAVGVGDTATTESAMEETADAWRTGTPLDAVRNIVDDFRTGGQLLPDGYERDPRNSQPEEYAGPIDIDTTTVRFGPRREVNAGAGAEPKGSRLDDIDSDGDDELRLEFDAEELSLSDDTMFARLYAETDDGFPVFATAPVEGGDTERTLRREIALSVG